MTPSDLYLLIGAVTGFIMAAATITYRLVQYKHFDMDDYVETIFISLGMMTFGIGVWPVVLLVGFAFGVAQMIAHLINKKEGK